MADPAAAFAREAPGVVSAEAASTDAYVHVYRAQLDETDETVRILALAPEAATDDDISAAFTRTAGQWRNPSTHPNVVTVSEQGDRPRPWLATPAVETRENWAPLSRARDALSPAVVGTVVTGAAEAVRNAALYNTTHSALAPDRVWVVTAEDGVGGMVDEWGLDRACRRAADERWLTPYTAPELVVDPDAVTEATDVYGLAAIAYFGLTGRPPVDPDADLETALPAVDPTPPSEVGDDVPPAADEAILRSLAPDPADRHPSAHAFAAALAETLPDAPEADLSGIGLSGSGASGAASAGSSDSSETDGTEGSGTATDSPADPTEGDTSASESSGSTARRAVLGALGLGALGVGGWAATQFGADGLPLGDGSGIGDGGGGGDDSRGDSADGASDGGAGAAVVGDETPTPTPRSGGSTAGGGSVDGPVRAAVLHAEADQYGGPQRRGAALAAREINDGDYAFGFDVEFVEIPFDPTEAVARAEQLRQEGVDLFVGGLAEETGVELGRFAEQSDSLFLSTAVGARTTGESCNDRTVDLGTGTDQTATVAGAFTGRELSPRVAFVYNDFEGAQRVFERTRSEIADRNDSFEQVAERAVPLGQSDFGAAIAEIADGAPSVIVLATVPQSTAPFLRQAIQAGVLDGQSIVAPTIGPWVGAGFDEIDPPEDNVSLFRSVRWLPSLSTGDNEAFVGAYEGAHDETPTPFARRSYDAVRTLARAVDRAGSAEPSTVAETLSGGTFPTTLGDVRVDPSTNRAANPVWIGEVSFGDDTGTDVIGQPLSPEEALPSADAVGCEGLDSTASR